MTTMTRGPRPPAVYWRRRLVVLLVALLLVIGTARLVGAVGGEDAAEEQAVQSSAESEVVEGAQEPSALPTSDAGSTGGDGAGTGAEDEQDPAQDEEQEKGKGKGKGASATAPPEPVGTCVPSDVRVQPEVEEAVAGRPVSIALKLRTRDALACTWEVSPRALTMKITSGPDEIWTSRQCPRAVPTEEVVLRNEGSTTVEVLWSSRRSDDGCTRLTDWAQAGYYHVTAAALAGEPRDVQFELTLPVAPVVTASPEPDAQGDEKKSKKNKNKNKKSRDEDEQDD